MTKHDSRSLVGRVVDERYRVDAFIANGGMASVFRAMDLRLDRPVALKVMRADLARDESFVSRFRREAHAAARLMSPHVVQVYDQGDDGTYVFLAMELVEGETLRDVIRRSAPMPIRQALTYLVPVVRGLEVAHRAGMIHRDIKPENVLIGARGQVKVADFGLARAVTSTTMTGSNAVLLGTAAYIAPEQVEHGRADARSDVYAAGLLLFELLTGEKAFSGDSPISVAYAHVHTGVPDVRDRVVVPREVDEALRRICAIDPEKRPADATALLETLEDLVVDLDAESLAQDPVLLDPSARAARTDDLGERPDPRRGTGTAVLPIGPAASGPMTEPAPPGPGPRRPVAEPSRADRPRQRRRGLVAALVLAIVAPLGGSGGYYYWWYNHEGPGATTLVPVLKGKQRAEAEQALRDAHLFPTVDTQFSEDVPKEQVISSSIDPGSSVSRGTEVRLVVSQGPERYTVPDVKGKTKDEATSTITAAHLTVGDVTEEYDETVPEGQVISVSPEPGTTERPGASVDLTVSKGREPVTVPTVTGETEDTARQTITDAGLVAETAPTEVYSTTVPKGSVVSQSPASGTLYRGDTVTLTISKGPEMVTVPDVVGDSTEDAKRKLKAAGFVVQVDRVLGGLFETARSTMPAGGTKAAKGSTVILTVV